MPESSVEVLHTHTGATPIAGRFTPGTLTNQITSSFREPRLLVVSDPIIDHQPIAEARYVSIPTIAFCNTNASLKYVDVAIPCNTEHNHSIGLMWWLLAREVCCCCCLPYWDSIRLNMTLYAVLELSISYGATYLVQFHSTNQLRLFRYGKCGELKVGILW